MESMENGVMVKKLVYVKGRRLHVGWSPRMLARVVKSADKVLE